MCHNGNSSCICEGFAASVDPVNQQVHCEDAVQPARWHPKHRTQQQDRHEGVLRDATGAKGQDGQHQHRHHGLLPPDLLALQPGDIEEADDGVAGQVDEHSDGEDETGNIWVNPIFVCQTLEGDWEGCNGRGSAKVDEKSLQIFLRQTLILRKSVPQSCQQRKEEDFFCE